ncbi:hypothetical protein [Burkholderia lata]|uniref:hypothetical protein n=1 Tax=Burkholderia lata (strain ATCC 17760 / DSM 23089 / LMG 22485 / NCIMB 9086 / R18194 / 383) TaxID=482957 RepID=UPI001584423C|nr:hypothetical protein [Burkholderia lata]
MQRHVEAEHRMAGGLHEPARLEPFLVMRGQIGARGQPVGRLPVGKVERINA